MTQALSLDLRERVVAAVSGGMSRRQAAERFGGRAPSVALQCAPAHRACGTDAETLGRLAARHAAGNGGHNTFT